MISVRKLELFEKHNVIRPLPGQRLFYARSNGQRYAGVLTGQGFRKKKRKHILLRVIPTVTSYYFILSQFLTFFVLKSGEDEEGRNTLMKSRALRSLDFIRIILSSSSLLLVPGPAVTTVIYLANLITANPGAQAPGGT